MGSSIVSDMYLAINRNRPLALKSWEARTAAWQATYIDRFKDANVSITRFDSAVFEFDHTAERVILAYAVSVMQLMQRDKSRMQGYPDINATIAGTLPRRSFVADKGHFLGHACGGELDINLFPHRRELNQGWSSEGKRFRAMESYVADHLGTFFYHHPIYNDRTDIPDQLEYGVLVDDSEWWVETFQNK